jgi:lysophospholipid acyltransferase (LPLAT)-like uncharacterized protein
LKIEGWRARVLVSFGYLLLRVWVLTLRFKLEDQSGILPSVLKQPYIFAVWHNRLLLLPCLFGRFLPSRPAAGLISASGDGDLIAALIEKFNYRTIRGSTSRKGASALLRLADAFAAGSHLVITPDGPRGPAYELGQGVVFLAQKCDSPVIPTGMEFSSSWRVRSWDRFFAPRPFSQVRFILGPPIRIAETPTPEQFEHERMRLQDAMMKLVKEK